MGKTYASTVGVVDLGGGSVQMAYAISEEDAVKAPQVSDGQDSYVQKLFLKGITYYLYVHRSDIFYLDYSHLWLYQLSEKNRVFEKKRWIVCSLFLSYLHYGLLAARAEILKASEGDNNCILNGYQGIITYAVNVTDSKIFKAPLNTDLDFWVLVLLTLTVS